MTHYFIHFALQVGKLIQNLEARFPEKSTISALSILNGKSLPDDEELVSYGNKEIETLWKWYATKLNCTQDELEDEWDSLKYELSESHRGDSVEKVNKNLTFMSNTAQVEHCFSKRNRIKTTYRNRLVLVVR